jgi:hypothetical protein
MLVTTFVQPLTISYLVFNLCSTCACHPKSDRPTSLSFVCAGIPGLRQEHMYVLFRSAVLPDSLSLGCHCRA